MRPPLWLAQASKPTGTDAVASARDKPASSPMLMHSARTAVAAMVSLLIAHLFRLPEVYWSAISTLVITQSSLGAALTVSWQRFVGTLLGAIVGGMVASFFGPGVAVFGATVFILGLLCILTRSDRSAYRFGGITLAIVMLVPGTAPAWRTAFDRFAETSIGIGVALILAVLWPDKEAATPSAVGKISQQNPEETTVDISK
jgi:uncharacterized membrane protein YgaE (UPF0421/DUF939 family)